MPETGEEPESAKPDLAGETDGVETHAPKAKPPGAVTAHLRTGKGIRGDVSLPSEDLPERSVAGPASEDRYGILGEIARGGMGAIVKLVDND
ncbi:MAG: hypothetical protein ACYTHN_14140, partial [Planctomycetota bacterium]